MSNTQQSPDPIVYVPILIKDLPEVNHNYFVVREGFEGSKYFDTSGFHDGEFDYLRKGYPHRTPDRILAWLKPTPLSELLKEKEDTIWALQGVIRDKAERIKELEAEVKRLAYLADYWQEKKK